MLPTLPPPPLFLTVSSLGLLFEKVEEYPLLYHKQIEVIEKKM